MVGAGDRPSWLGCPAGAHLEQDPTAVPEKLGVVRWYLGVYYHIRHESGS
uniref:Uncharacterized protein n=1 Tax=Nonomuraea gerenzanensis TaxID=93944 RepID=A0A1M4E9E1_9ACTN|nr:hypothetical protein BN4615_P4981 [Nonomuraea gerenzanensis]